MSDVPSVDLSFEALMPEIGLQLEYKEHSKYTRRIIDLLRLIRNLGDVANSLYCETRRSCHDEVEKLRDEILCDENSLIHEKEDLEKDIKFRRKQEWEIRSGQGEAPVNGRDHQVIKNFLESALQKRFETFEGVGSIRVWGLFSDRVYLDRLISRLQPGHGMQAYRIKPVINKCYRSVAHERDPHRS
ncbi:hypothetical protein EAF00_003190 [Botryotinia globosa]|nr:hypothetical protein EAF00_003190 [Botryotinia globosa]